MNVGALFNGFNIVYFSAGLSRCQQERQRALGILGVAPPGRFVPACASTGEYQQVQCHQSTGYCWCVDEHGRESPNTRARGRVVCDALGKFSCFS
jgi:hypothetical protein